MIPDLVRATVDLHVVQTQIQLERVRENLAGLAVLSAPAKRLRVRRDRLSQQLDAWLHIAASLDKEVT